MRRVAAAAALLWLALPATAHAHGLVGRQDLPIPRWLFFWGAAVVLVVSFVALAVLWAEPKLEDAPERRVAKIPRALEVLCGALGVALFCLVVYAGLAGTQIVPDNLAPTAIYVLFWVGVPVASLFFGDVFAAFNPWRAIGRAAGWIGRRGGGDVMPEALEYPSRLGRWPAALTILAFTWVELVSADGDDPSTLAVLAIAYAAIQLVGMSLYGVAPWIRNARRVLRPVLPVRAHLTAALGRRGAVAAQAAGGAPEDQLGARDRRADVRGRREHELRRVLGREAVERLGPRAAVRRAGPRAQPEARDRGGLHGRSAGRRARGRLGLRHRRHRHAPRRSPARPGGAGAPVRPHPGADRAGLRGRALLLAAGLPGPGARAAGVGPCWATAPICWGPRTTRSTTASSAPTTSGTCRSGRSWWATCAPWCSPTTARWSPSHAAGSRSCRRCSCCW